MRTTDVIVIGAGQAGLAMSWELGARGIDHVVLERRRIAERWRSERWDSLRLLTPNWATRLPGWRYRGRDPHGFMPMPEVVRFFENYAASFFAPVETDAEVLAVERHGAGWKVGTTAGDWSARGVVIATGHCDAPRVPAMGWALPRGVRQIAPGAYRNPAALPGGGVLVVGASASGVQIADELNRAGRRVMLAAGRHTRLPRRYRGRDIFCWLERIGVLDETVDEVANLEAARRQPSLQLVGDPARAVDLASLSRRGVRVLGRACGAGDGRMDFAGDLAGTTGAAARKLAGVTQRIDRWIERSGLGEAFPPETLAPEVLHAGPARLDLAAERIGTVIWATGFRRRYPWLKAPVLDASGEIRHAGGVTPAPGLCVIGLRFLRRRKSSFIDGVADDAAALAGHLARHLGAERRIAV